MQVLANRTSVLTVIMLSALCMSGVAQESRRSTLRVRVDARDAPVYNIRS